MVEHVRKMARMTDFTLTEDQIAVRDRVRFAAENIASHATMN